MENEILNKINYKNLSKEELVELLFDFSSAELSYILATIDSNFKKKPSPISNLWRGFRKGAELPKPKITTFLNLIYDDENLGFILKILIIELLKKYSVDVNNIDIEQITNISNVALQVSLLKLFNLEKTYTSVEVYQKLLEQENKFKEEKEKEFIKLKEDTFKELFDEQNKNKELLDRIADLNIELNELNGKYSALDKELVGIKKEKKNLEEELKEYKNETTSLKRESACSTTDVLKDFLKYLLERGLSYTKEDVFNFHYALMTRNLTILAGTPGIGKSRLALEYANFFHLSEEDETLLFVPISPSYTEPSDLLGFLNPRNQEFVPTETNLAHFLVHASNHKEKVHMLIFDEMNLAQIEYYFAPFISNLEKNRRKISLYAKGIECNNKDKYPCEIELGDNLLIVGTINIDETTKDMSYRLLDRVYLINLNEESFIKYRNSQKIYKGVRSNYNYYLDDYLLNIPDNYTILNNISSEVISFLEEVNSVLKNEIMPFSLSYRNLFNIDILIYLMQENSVSLADAIDNAFLLVTCPKISGNSLILGDLISKLLELLNKYKELSEFKASKKALEWKQKELDKYGYTR